MRTVWKIVIVLALVLPSGAFVAGSLAASSADRPSPRHTIVIRDDSASAPPSPRRAGPSAQRSDDHPDRSVEVVTPTPGDLRDDHGGTSGGTGGGGHDSGSGSGSGHSGGSDDGGGHGGGHG